MRKLFVLALLLPLAAFGSDHYLATLTSSGNSTSYTATRGAHLAVQCDAPVYLTQAASTATATSTSGEKVAADVLFEVPFAGKEDTVAIIPVSGSASCKVFAVAP